MKIFIIFYTVYYLSSFPSYVVPEERNFVTCDPVRAEYFYDLLMENADSVRVDTLFKN